MDRTLAVVAAIAFAALMIGGCGEESVNRPAPEGTVGLKIAFDLTSDYGSVTNIHDINNHIQTNSAPIGDGSPDSVTVTSGLAMVRSLRFVADPTAAVDTNITASDEQHDLTDASVRFQGPYVLVVTGGAQELETAPVPAGVYGQLRLVLQKARSTDDLSGHTELVGSSVRVSGTIWRDGQGTDFTYTTDYTSEIAVNGTFNIAASADGDLAITFDASRWFQFGRGWLDPTDPTNRLQILRNLRSNISARIVVGS
jgi:hypothetical protein